MRSRLFCSSLRQSIQRFNEPERVQGIEYACHRSRDGETSTTNIRCAPYRTDLAEISVCYLCAIGAAILAGGKFYLADDRKAFNVDPTALAIAYYRGNDPDKLADCIEIYLSNNSVDADEMRLRSRWHASIKSAPSSWGPFWGLYLNEYIHLFYF